MFTQEKNKVDPVYYPYDYVTCCKHTSQLHIILSFQGATAMLARSFALYCILTLSTGGNSGSPANGALNDFSFETSVFMTHSAYRDVSNLNLESSPDGAYGAVNQVWDKSHRGNWYIEEQRPGADLVAGGIAVNNTDAIERGLRILNWGFAQQRPDGGFHCPDTFHSTSFFVEAVAHSLLMLQGSKYSDQYSQIIADMKPKLLLAAQWMTVPQNESHGKKDNRRYTHRRYLVAAALGETGVLMGEASLIARSESYVRDGIALQSAAGYNPELGGWDSSYNAKGMVFASRYYTIVANDEMRQALYQMLDKAARWEASRIDDDGRINTQGNTRVGGKKTEKGRLGKGKKVETRQVYEAFFYWSVISGDTSYEKLAQKVAQRSIEKNPNA
jgi:hypothetical protein